MGCVGFCEEEDAQEIRRESDKVEARQTEQRESVWKREIKYYDVDAIL